MSEQDQHLNKRSTGTVPKQRIRYTRSVTEVDRLRSLSNSSSDYYHDPYNELRSPRRSNQTVDSTIQMQGVSPIQVGSINLNSVGSSNPSSTPSRKNSLGPALKCDNITKHPNKRQIEDKLNQIHEYLKVTNSLMASIQKVDNQGLAQNDEIAESDISSKRNDGNLNSENLGLNLMALKEQEGTSLLQRKTENKCLSPRQNRSNLLVEVCNHVNSTTNRNDVHYDSRYKERGEKRKFHPHPQLIPTQDKSILNMDGLHNHILDNNVNDNGDQLYDALEYEEAGLEIQHQELHKKIIELQNRKFQIDQFIAQLQNSGAHGEDVEHQMMKICAMKAQLKKLKNMLEIVKLPMNMENTNHPPDYEKPGCYLCSSNGKIKSGLHNESNFYRSASGNDSRVKQLNKNSIEKSKIQPTKANVSSSITQKSSLQSELELKKRELVEIMEKHKANPSNLNQDFGIDTKSDISFLMNGINDPWASVISNDSDSDRFSSDEYQNDVNEDVKHNFLLPSPKYPSGASNSQSENLQRGNFDFRSVNRRAYTPEPNYRSSSNVTATRKNKSRLSNTQETHTNQTQKQLEIIRSMCDSMLDHQNNQEPYSNQQHIQNNQIHSSHQQNSSRNSDSGVNSDIQPQWTPSNANNIDSWMNTNNVQTQSFVLNTLNQCYQMLWVQQKEIAGLKNSVSVLQERLKNTPFEPPVSSTIHVNQQTPPSRHFQQQPPQQPADLEPKINQDGYIPVTNQFDCPISSIYFNPVNNSNNQMLESCLNNINLNRINVDQNSEQGLHGNMSHLMPNHIWSGQALNNQVVPGNRANNYWDNFRSYSRQNLLSSKNNEVLQNLPTIVDRPNFINQCANPFAFIPLSKSNSEQHSANTTQETVYQRLPFKDTNPGLNSGAQSTLPIVSDAISKNEEVESPSKDVFHKDNNSQFGLPLLAPNLRTNPECLSSETVPKRASQEQSKRSDRRNKSTVEECQCVRSNYDDVKENIYKEVASLISANENRPQFLIQLFRDLQLHSIESNVSNSSVLPVPLSSQQFNQSSTYLQPTSSVDFNTPQGLSNNNDAVCKTLSQEIQLFLDRHDEETLFQNNFLHSLKEFLLNLQLFNQIFKDKFRFHFIRAIDLELQILYNDKKLGDIKPQLLKTINDLVHGHRHFASFTNETSSSIDEHGASIDSSEVALNKNAGTNSTNTEQAQTPINEDLAEADQSQSVSEDFSDEGAVGGILDASQIKVNEYLDPVSTRATSSDISQTESSHPVEDPKLSGAQNNAAKFLDQ